MAPSKTEGGRLAGQIRVHYTRARARRRPGQTDNDYCRRSRACASGRASEPGLTYSLGGPHLAGMLAGRLMNINSAIDGGRSIARRPRHPRRAPQSRAEDPIKVSRSSGRSIWQARAGWQLVGLLLGCRRRGCPFFIRRPRQSGRALERRQTFHFSARQTLKLSASARQRVQASARWCDWRARRPAAAPSCSGSSCWPACSAICCSSCCCCSQASSSEQVSHWVARVHWGSRGGSVGARLTGRPTDRPTGRHGDADQLAGFAGRKHTGRRLPGSESPRPASQQEGASEFNLLGTGK